MRPSPMSATTVMLKPKLSASLSTPSKAFLRGKSAAVSAYPGKISTKGKPRITRRALEGKKVITKISKMLRILSKMRSF